MRTEHSSDAVACSISDDDAVEFNLPQTPLVFKITDKCAAICLVCCESAQVTSVSCSASHRIVRAK